MSELEMDKKTFAQLLLVCTAILVGWWAASYLLRDRLFAPPARPARPVEALPAPPPAPAVQSREEPVLAAAPQPPEETAIEREDNIVLANDLIRTYWTNHGASLQKLELLDRRYLAPYTVDGKRPLLTLLRDFQDGYYSDTVQSITFAAAASPEAAGHFGEVQTYMLTYRLAEQKEDRLVFERTVDDGYGHRMLMRKTVAIAPGRYDFDVTLEFENPSQTPYEFTCALRGAAGIEREEPVSPYLGTRVGAWQGGDACGITSVQAGGLQKGPRVNESASIAWAGVVNHYFIAITCPDSRDWIRSVESRLVTDMDLLRGSGRWAHEPIRESDRPRLASQNATVVMRTVPERLEPGRTVAQEYRFIAAPKEDEILTSYGAGMPALTEFGRLAPISRLALALLKGIRSVIPNYGVAILVLTLIVRIILHPLTRMSQLSMTRMQKLQPHVAELQRKYANDKPKLAQEQMALFRRYGVSPLSGCWPTFLQLPVLIALFYALRGAIALRQAGFLWVKDLSRPDTLFYFPPQILLLGNKGFNPLPILMGGAMFLNQQFTPEPAGEQALRQHRMMKWFLLLFVVMFYSAPSGLCLYWTASTLVGLLERWVIDRKASAIELKPVDAAAPREKREKPVTKGSQPAGWLEKLQRRLEGAPRARRSGKHGSKE